MLRRTALAALLLLSADTALAPLGASSLTAEATAADFTGRIKNVKIRKKRVGSDFKMVIQTTGDTSDSVARVETYVHPSSGVKKDEQLEVIVLDIDVSSRLVGTGGADDKLSAASTVAVFLSNDPKDDFSWDEGKEYTSEERTRLEIELDSGQGEGATKDGRKVRVRVTRDGALRVIVSHEDRSWDPDTVASIGYAPDGGTVRPVRIDEVRQKWVSDLETDLSALDAVIVETILYDAEGAVLDTQTQTVALTEDAASVISNVTLKETRQGAAKLVTWTTSSGDADSLEVTLTDRETGAAVIETVDDTPVLTERTFLYEGLEFDAGESAEGFVYLCLIDLIGTDGDPVGEQYEVELSIPALAEGEDFALAPASFADGTGSVSILSTGDGYHVVAALWHEDAGQAETLNLIFEGPFEGPAPLAQEVGAAVVSQRDKWIQKGEGAMPTDYDLTATLTTAEGEVLESVFASGSGTGRAYAEHTQPGTVVSIGAKEVLLNIGFKSE